MMISVNHYNCTHYTDGCSSNCNPRSDELPYASCCEPENFGGFIKVIKSNIHRGYLSCPPYAPDWCVSVK